jgi:aminoglycoside phosphotransferase (APT) family kinase protein
VLVSSPAQTACRRVCDRAAIPSSERAYALPVDADLLWIAKATGAETVQRGERIQSVWSGYGEIFRVHLAGAAGAARADMPSAVVKSVKPPARRRSATTDASHARKCRSYDVETAWYRNFAPRCDATCRVPRLIDSRVSNDAWIFLLEDLDAAGFSKRRRRHPEATALDRCLAWLAALHARFLGVAPEGLWKTGTYWHLGTRPDELAALEDEALREAAPVLDRMLRQCAFRTIVHGDAKLANFCFAPGGGAVAAVDFQYVGGGCGMKDVAYFLSSCSDDGFDPEERRHLDRYFELLRGALALHPGAVDVDALETEWRALYPIACADFYRFLAGWAKEHWRGDGHGHRVIREVLRTLA